MSRVQIDLPKLLSVVDDRRAVEVLQRYFQPNRAPECPPTYSGSRFELFAGGGDRPETANWITDDDLVAVTLLSVDVPGDVALQLLEGPLGPAIGAHLAQIPTNIAIGEPAASGLFAVGSSARAAWDLLDEPRALSVNLG